MELLFSSDAATHLIHSDAAAGSEVPSSFPKRTVPHLANIVVMTMHHRRPQSTMWQELYGRTKESVKLQFNPPPPSPFNTTAQLLILKDSVKAGREPFNELFGQLRNPEVIAKIREAMLRKLRDTTDNFKVTAIDDSPFYISFLDYIKADSHLTSSLNVILKRLQYMITEDVDIFNIASYHGVIAKLLPTFPEHIQQYFHVNLKNLKDFELLLWTGDESRQAAQLQCELDNFYTDSACKVICYLFKLIDAFQESLDELGRLLPVDQTFDDMHRCIFSTLRSFVCGLLIAFSREGKESSLPIRFVMVDGVVATASYFFATEKHVCDNSGIDVVPVNGDLVPFQEITFKHGTSWMEARQLDIKSLLGRVIRSAQCRLHARKNTKAPEVIASELESGSQFDGSGGGGGGGGGGSAPGFDG
jgi:hypothetical protein